MGREPTATNRGMAITGLMTGIVGLGLSTLYTVWLVTAAPWSNPGKPECVGRSDASTGTLLPAGEITERGWVRDCGPRGR